VVRHRLLPVEARSHAARRRQIDAQLMHAGNRRAVDAVGEWAQHLDITHDFHSGPRSMGIWACTRCNYAPPASSALTGHAARTAPQ